MLKFPTWSLNWGSLIKISHDLVLACMLHIPILAHAWSLLLYQVRSTTVKPCICNYPYCQRFKSCGMLMLSHLVNTSHCFKGLYSLHLQSKPVPLGHIVTSCLSWIFLTLAARTWNLAPLYQHFISPVSTYDYALSSSTAAKLPLTNSNCYIQEISATL